MMNEITYSNIIKDSVKATEKKINRNLTEDETKIIKHAIRAALNEVNSLESDDKNQMVLDELKGWLLQGITCLKSDNYSEQEKPIIDLKANTMDMILQKINELENSL
ncbi:hypothetical protein [Pseudobacteroides cellulosolvens]|uniref:Uncharacterized protein n=1 Tax=Pseudobacteroides cellulosolvens ATCC 35603 = DSM 2933 TaxID=398512 RepID=A0A0L6JKS2_9FIRM|nr:hypothetical protein [Pseudobacteroides cellulosolvens]KNY26360.1 hypothetical protein Bccel_1622 [Pseudobacteroides cellulosolvens ATCC 35603 = DSM 2933]